MKRITAILVTLLITVLTITAQPPQAFKYKAIARDNRGRLIVNKQVNMRISLLQGSETGITAYVETHTVFTKLHGIFELEIGKGTPVTGTFPAIDWGNGDYFIKIEMDPHLGIHGHPGYTVIGTSQLLSVPYALYAGDAKNNFGDDFNDLTNKPTTLAGYGITDAASKAYVDAILSQLNSKGVIVGDADGNYYPTIRIGSQIWMAENLRTTTYNDGTDIPLVTGNSEWSSLNTPAYCWYDNNELLYKNTFGALYNWYAMSPATNGGKNLCPTGWRVPSNEDWNVLIHHLIDNGYNYNGSTTGQIIGKSLAAATCWNPSDVEGAVGNTDYSGKRNATGFTGLPSGVRNDNGNFYGTGSNCEWGSTTAEGGGTVWRHTLFNYEAFLFIDIELEKSGLSVRCVKDDASVCPPAE